MIKEFGGKVESIWEGLRPVTKNMLVGALTAGNSGILNPKTPKFFYDAHADFEVSSLLSALDERSKSNEIRRDAVRLGEINQLANICVLVLESQSASAEVFIQLAERAIKDNDYNRLDKLGDHLAERYSAGEIAEVVRQTEMPQIRAIAYETLAMISISSLVPLLDDPLYAGIAAGALEQKAFEFDNEEARDILEQFDAENDQGGN